MGIDKDNLAKELFITDSKTRCAPYSGPQISDNSLRW
jgi:hypothetical protein